MSKLGDGRVSAAANSSPKPAQIRVAQGIYTPNQRGGSTLDDWKATFQFINSPALKEAYAGYGEPDPNAPEVD